MSTERSFEDFYLSPDYMNPFNSMAGYDAVMVIETANDREFWTNLSTLAAPEKKIQIYPASRIDRADGKREIEKIYDKASEHVLLAIDSDYDYSAQMESGNSKLVNENKYIIQTFVYSKESVIQHHETLNKFALMIPLDTIKTLKVKEYLEDYSYSIYPLMTSHLYLKSKGNDSHESEVKTAITPKAPFFDENYIDTSGAISDVEKAATALNKKLSKEITDKDDFAAFIDILNKKNITEKTMYSYIEGHLLENKVVKPLLKAAKDACFHFEKEEIYKMHPGKITKAVTQKINSIKNKMDKKMNIDTYLHTTPYTYQAPHAQKIIESIKSALSPT